MKIEDEMNWNEKYDAYIESVENVYQDERLEVYYYPLIKKFLQSIGSLEKKVINVSENKKATGIHAGKKSVYTISGGLPDLIWTSKSYTYENPVRPYIVVEIKAPDITIEASVITRYNKVKPEKYEKQLRKEFKKNTYVIFSDCITWYLLKKNGRGFEKRNEISLLEALSNGNWGWKRSNEDNGWNDLALEINKFLGDAKKDI